MGWIIDSYNTLAEAIANYIGMALEILFYGTSYPFVLTAYWLSAITHLIIDPFIEYNGYMWGFGSSIFDFLLTVIGSILPFKLGILLFTAITIVILLRLYYFLKDIQIFGWSI